METRLGWFDPQAWKGLLSVVCCGEVVSATGVGSSGVASREFSEVVVASWVTTTLLFLINGLGVEDSDDSSSD